MHSEMIKNGDMTKRTQSEVICRDGNCQKQQMVHFMPQASPVPRLRGAFSAMIGPARVESQGSLETTGLTRLERLQQRIASKLPWSPAGFRHVVLKRLGTPFNIHIRGFSQPAPYAEVATVPLAAGPPVQSQQVAAFDISLVKAGLLAFSLLAAATAAGLKCCGSAIQDVRDVSLQTLAKPLAKEPQPDVGEVAAAAVKQSKDAVAARAAAQIFLSRLYAEAEFKATRSYLARVYAQVLA